MKRIFGKFGNVICWLLMLVLLVVAGIVAASALGLPNQLKIFVVQTGSMEPAVKVGSLAIVQTNNNYSINDIITFKTKKDANINNPKYTLTHRITKIENSENKILYTTKGDANKTADFDKVEKTFILGKVILALPYVGYPVGFAKTQNGFILLIVIPATIIIYSELMNIKKETKKLLEERKRRKLTTKEKIEEKIGEEIIAIEKDIKEVAKKI